MAKTILIPNSAFFAKHFSENGPKANVIKIEASQFAMEALIKYIHLEKSDDLKEHVDEIFHIAAKYEFKHIQVKILTVL